MPRTGLRYRSPLKGHPQRQINGGRGTEGEARGQGTRGVQSGAEAERTGQGARRGRASGKAERRTSGTAEGGETASGSGCGEQKGVVSRCPHRCLVGPPGAASLPATLPTCSLGAGQAPLQAGCWELNFIQTSACPWSPPDHSLTSAPLWRDVGWGRHCLSGEELV